MLFRLSFILLLPALLAGCAAKSAAPAKPQSADATGAAAMSKSQAARVRDAMPALTIVFQVEIYQLAVPFGTFSSNEDFWRRVDEQGVDVATYDLLYRNGIRAGRAPLGELQQFRKYLSEFIPAQRFTVTAVEVKNVEIPMKKELPEQTIFYFDDRNALIGNSFGRCENVMSIAFEPTPRRPGFLRLTLCPVVRSQRRVLQFAPTNNDVRELEFVHPERLYDLNLRADIPRDGFLIVTASDDARRSTSVGRAFMTIDAPAERMEQVLLIIPKPYVASDASAGAAAP